jgi:tRNA(Ile)-lysidine synthase TilS/MesJ
LSVTFLNLEDVFRIHKSEEAKMDESKEQDLVSKLRIALDTLPETGSCREDLVEHYKRQLIVHHARGKNIKKIFLGNNGQRTTAKLFSCLAKGRGINLPMEVNYIEDFSGISLMKPLREFLEKEVACSKRDHTSTKM